MAYDKFAEIYDELMTLDIDYNNWYTYIKNIFNRYDKQPKTILEMACGTGNLTNYLAEDMYDISAFDLSEEMLSIAHNKLRKHKNVSLRYMDMKNFKFNKKFDAIISICDSINYITEKKDLANVFDNVYNHLNSGGIFIFDINSYYKLSKIIGNNTFVHDDEKVFYVWENNFENNLSEFLITFFVKRNDIYERFDEYHLERAYTSPEIINQLKSTGFKDIYEFDGLTFNSKKYNSERINFVAIK